LFATMLDSALQRADRRHELPAEATAVPNRAGIGQVA
jgi:hypothetical protein